MDRLDTPLEMWVVLDPTGTGRTFPCREVAEANMEPGGQLFRGPPYVGDILELCEEQDLSDIDPGYNAAGGDQ